MRVSDLLAQLEEKDGDLEVIIDNGQGEYFEISPDVMFQYQERRVLLELTGEYTEPE